MVSAGIWTAAASRFPSILSRISAGCRSQRSLFCSRSSGISHNVHKHSKSPSVEVSLRTAGDKVVLQVRDYEKGFPDARWKSFRKPARTPESDSPECVSGSGSRWASLRSNRMKPALLLKSSCQLPFPPASPRSPPPQLLRLDPRWFARSSGQEKPESKKVNNGRDDWI